MEEQERVASQALARDVHDVPSAREPCLGVPNAPFGLAAAFPQPLVGEGEAGAAMIVLSIVDPPGPASFKDRAVFR